MILKQYVEIITSFISYSNKKMNFLVKEIGGEVPN